MATKPDGKAVRTERVTFTKPAAERIAKVVRTVEQGDRNGSPLVFNAAVASAIGATKLVRVATFTGSWAIGNTNVVTFTYAPTATVNAVNLSWPITHNHASPENCIVGKEGTSWYLVVPVLQTATAVFVTKTALGTSVSEIVSLSVLQDISLSAVLDTSNCAITLSKTLVTSSASFIGKTATTTIITGSATASYLRLRVPT